MSDRDSHRLLRACLRSRIARYPHFDALPGRRFLERLAAGTYDLRRHPFHPAISRIDRRRRFPKKGRETTKQRPIRYVSHKDKLVMARVRYAWYEMHETFLTRFGLENNVLAYRKNGDNVHWARYMFERIEAYRPCHVFCLDIKGFFDNLSHEVLERQIRFVSIMIRGKHLEDYEEYIMNMTMNYAYIDEKVIMKHIGGPLRGIRIMPPAAFRNMVADGGTIVRNREGKGIPQGYPVSDVLSNIHLSGFDILMSRYVGDRGWYGRYADDIAVVLRRDARDPSDVVADIEAMLAHVDPGLEVNREKSSYYLVESDGCRTTIRDIRKDREVRGIEYLGFIWDGREVFVRDSTMSRFERKALRKAIAIAIELGKLGYSRDRARLKVRQIVFEQFYKNRDWQEAKKDFRNWTFYSYMKRARRTMGAMGTGLERQMTGIRARLDQAVTRALERVYGQRA